MNNKVINIIQIVVIALSLCTLLVAAALFASTVGVPNDDVGALHNLSANLRGMLFLIISGVLLVADTVWLIVRAVLAKKK